jgi:hypothetical protein
MRKLMVDFIISLDGFGAAEGWPGLRGMAGPEYLAWLEPVEHRAFGNRLQLLEYVPTVPDAPPGLAAEGRSEKA